MVVWVFSPQDECLRDIKRAQGKAGPVGGMVLMLGSSREVDSTHRLAAEMFDAWGIQPRCSSGLTPHRGIVGESTPDVHPSWPLASRNLPLPRCFLMAPAFPTEHPAPYPPAQPSNAGTWQQPRNARLQPRIFWRQTEPSWTPLEMVCDHLG